MMEEYIQERAKELYAEWCNDPDANVTDIIAKGMLEVYRRPVIELAPSGDYQVDVHRFARIGPDGVLDYLEDCLVIEGETADRLRGLASQFVLSEEELLQHLVNLGRLVASTTLYIMDIGGDYVALEEIK